MFKAMKVKNVQPRILYLARLSFRFDGEQNFTKTELCPPEQQPALPSTSPSHQEASTSHLDSLIHQKADSRSKNYDPAELWNKNHIHR